MDVKILKRMSVLKKIIMGIELKRSEDLKASVLQRDVPAGRIKCLCCKSADRIKNDLSDLCDCLIEFVWKLEQSEGFTQENLI